MACSCCGREGVPTATLGSNPEVRLCRDCVGWLGAQLGIASTPTLPGRLRPAVEFYERAGFGVRVYNDELDTPGAGFAFVDYDGQSVFDLDVVDVDPERNWAGCYLVVDDPDGWHTRMTAAGLDVSSVKD